MKPRFALSLSPADAHGLGALRRWAGVEVCDTPQAVWLRAAHLEEDQWERCRKLPGADRFTLLDDGRLLAVGARVPRGRLPEGPWQPLAAWMNLELPAADSTSATSSRAALKLVRSAEQREVAWLLTTLDAWNAYIARAPQVRLARWSFAADPAGRVIVRGRPLPPLAGERFTETDGIAVPAGWSWSPAVGADVVRSVFGLEKGNSVCWLSDGSWRPIAAGDWVQATRSAVRLTAEKLAEQSGGAGP